MGEGDETCCDKIFGNCARTVLRVAYAIYLVMAIVMFGLATWQVVKGKADPAAPTALGFMIVAVFIFLIGALATYALWKETPVWKLLLFVNVVNTIAFIFLLAFTVIMIVVVWDIQDPVRTAVMKSWPKVEATLGATYCAKSGGTACTAEGANVTSLMCVSSCQLAAINKINENQIMIQFVAFVLSVLLATAYFTNEHTAALKEDKEAKGSNAGNNEHDNCGDKICANLSTVLNIFIILLGSIVVALAGWVGNQTGFESWTVKGCMAIGIMVILCGLLSILAHKCCGGKCGTDNVQSAMAYIMAILSFLFLLFGIFMAANASVITSLNSKIDTQWDKVHDTFKEEHPDLYRSYKACNNYNATATAGGVAGTMAAPAAATVAPTTGAATATVATGSWAAAAAASAEAAACKAAIMAQVRTNGKTAAVFACILLGGQFLLLGLTSKYFKYLRLKSMTEGGPGSYGGTAHM